MQVLIIKIQTMCHFFQRTILQSIFLLMMIPQTHAAVVEGLYEVEIPLVGQSVNARRAAFNQGLKEVLIRVTGDGHIFSLIKLPSSSSYVKQYQYRELERKNKTSSIEKKQSPTQLLWMQFMFWCPKKRLCRLWDRL